MSTENPKKPNIFTSIQAEVGADQSALLEWLTAHASKIIGAIVLFIIAIGIYWGYSSYADRKTITQRQEFSHMLASSTPDTILDNLQNYIATAPNTTKATALGTLAMEAQNQGNYEVALNAWEQLGKLAPELRIEASFGMSKAWLSMENPQKAMEVLESALPGADMLYLVNLNSQIAAIAESTGNTTRAVTAYEALVAFANTQSNFDREKQEFWKTRLNFLKAKD